MVEYYNYDEILLALEDPVALEKYTCQYDLLWKGILEPTFWHFMAFTFPKLMSKYDANCQVEFLDKELQQLLSGPNGKKGVRYVDKLAKVILPNGTPNYFLIHIEVQSSKGDGDLGRRIFEYWYRLYDKYKVPITTVAILADEVKSYRPEGFNLVFMGTENHFKFNSIKILDQDEEQLRNNPNPFAVVMLTALLALKNKRVDDEKLLSIKIDLYRQMRKREMTEDCMRGVYGFLSRYVHFDNQENMFKFENQLKEEFGGDTIMGIEELLLEDAEKKGRIKMLQELGYSILDICKRLNLTEYDVKSVLKQI